MMAGFGSEYVASFELEWVAGFVGIRSPQHGTEIFIHSAAAERLRPGDCLSADGNDAAAELLDQHCVNAGNAPAADDGGS